MVMFMRKIELLLLCSLFVGCSNNGQTVLLFAGCYNLKSFVATEVNAHFSSKDGVLFDKSTKTLLAYPNARRINLYTPIVVFSLILLFVIVVFKHISKQIRHFFAIIVFIPNPFDRIAFLIILFYHFRIEQIICRF